MSDEQNKGFNWGKGLFIAIVLFVVATLGIVAFLVSLDYEMVTDNHYEEAVKYQSHIDKVEHASKLTEPVAIELLQEDDQIQIRFPASLHQKNPTGIINLYRPNNSDLDQRLKLAINEQGMQIISVNDLAKGKWLVKLTWTADSTSYFKEEYIFL